MKCLFCDKPSTHQRLINNMMVALCKDDYQNKSTGKIVAKLRKKSNGTKSGEEALQIQQSRVQSGSKAGKKSRQETPHKA